MANLLFLSVAQRLEDSSWEDFQNHAGSIRLARGREELHRGLDAATFENAFRHRFDIVKSRPIEGAAPRLYLLRRKA